MFLILPVWHDWVKIYEMLGLLILPESDVSWLWLCDSDCSECLR